MTKMDRCPICNVAVKRENLLRHLDEIHPRHPETPELREKLRAEPGRIPRRKSGPPIHVRRWQVIVVVIVLGGVGAFYLVQSLSAPVFPCITREGGVLYHWHAQLEIFSGSARVEIPANIGISTFCLQPLHTHSPDGQIHIESDIDRRYSIGDFFAVWKKPFGSPTQMFVNDTAEPASPSVILYDGTTIRLHYSFFA